MQLASYIKVYLDDLISSTTTVPVQLHYISMNIFGHRIWFEGWKSISYPTLLVVKLIKLANEMWRKCKKVISLAQGICKMNIRQCLFFEKGNTFLILLRQGHSRYSSPEIINYYYWVAESYWLKHSELSWKCKRDFPRKNKFLIRLILGLFLSAGNLS